MQHYDKGKMEIKILLQAVQSPELSSHLPLGANTLPRSVKTV